MCKTIKPWRYHFVDKHCASRVPRNIVNYKVESGAVITRSRIIWYYIHHCRHCSRIQIRVWTHKGYPIHYSDVIMSTMVSHIRVVSIVCATVCSSLLISNETSLAFVRGIHRWHVVPLTKGSVTRKCFHLMSSSCYNGAARYPASNLWYPMERVICIVIYILFDKNDRVKCDTICKSVFFRCIIFVNIKLIAWVAN